MLLQLGNTEVRYIKNNCLIFFWLFSLPIFSLELAKPINIPTVFKITIAVFYISMFIGVNIYLDRFFDPSDKGRILHPDLINVEPAKRKNLFSTYFFMIVAGTFPPNFIKIFELPFFYHILALTGLMIMVSLIIYFGGFAKVYQNHSQHAFSLPDFDLLTGFIIFFLLIMGMISILLVKSTIL